jgi:cytochrome bd-type quinol oxidase subunit 2
VCIYSGLRRSDLKSESRGVVGAAIFLYGLSGSWAATCYPEMLHSTLGDEFSITAPGGAASPHGLRVALVWWPIALVLTLGYAASVAWAYRGKVREMPGSQGDYDASVTR